MLIDVPSHIIIMQQIDVESLGMCMYKYVQLYMLFFFKCKLYFLLCVPHV